MARPGAARAAAATGMVLGAVAPVLAFFYVDPDLLGSRYLYLALLAGRCCSRRAPQPSPRAGRAMAPLLCLDRVLDPRTRSHLLTVAGERCDDPRNGSLQRPREPRTPAARAGSCPECQRRSRVCRLFSTASRKPRVRAWWTDSHGAAAQADGQCQLTWTGEGFQRVEWSPMANFRVPITKALPTPPRPIPNLIWSLALGMPWSVRSCWHWSFLRMRCSLPARQWRPGRVDARRSDAYRAPRFRAA